MGWFCFCSGLSLRGVMRILKTVLPQTFTTGTWRCSCQWQIWNVYTGQMCVPSIQNGLKEHRPMQGGADGLGNPLHSPKWNCHFQSGGISPDVWSLVPVSAELSEEWLAFASEVCDPSRLQSQEHAASRRAVSSCVWQLPCSQRCLTDVTWRNHAFHANSPEVSSTAKGKSEMRRPGGSRCNSTILWM